MQYVIVAMKAKIIVIKIASLICEDTFILFTMYSIPNEER